MVRLGPWVFRVTELTEYQAYGQWYEHVQACEGCRLHPTMPCATGFRLHEQWRAAEARERRQGRAA